MHKKILVAFATGSGSTGEVAQAIGDVLGETGVPVDVRAAETVSSVSGYSAVVLGSSIRLGRWLPQAIRFLKTFKEEMQNKPVAYFTTCLTLINDTEKNRRAVLRYLQPVLRLAPGIEPVGLGLFAGSFMTEQQTIPAHTGLGPIGDHRNWEAIKAWAAAIRPEILAGEVKGTQRPYNLKKVTLSFSDLSGTDLRQSNLWQADLQETRLQSANLHKANLRESDLTQSDLRNANLQDAELGWAELSQSQLMDANLQEASLLGANLEGADLSRADLRQATLNGANLRQATLRHAQLNQANLNWANLRRADLREADLQHAHLGWADLSNADLSEANLKNALYNEHTKWPDDFPVEESGCVFVTWQT